MIARLMAGVALLSLSSCGIDERPSSAAAPTEAAPAYVVAIPVPKPKPLPVNRAPHAMTASIAQLVREFPGIAGVAVRAVDEGWTVEAGGRRPLPQQSVSKLWVAMTVLDQRDSGRLRLDDAVSLTPADLTLFHQPSAMLVKNGVWNTTVSDLLFRALTQSDNTANDRLLTLVGGPQAVRAFIERKQLGDIRFGPGERLLQAGTAGLTWDQSMSVGNTFAVMRARLDPGVRAAAHRSCCAPSADFERLLLQRIGWFSAAPFPQTPRHAALVPASTRPRTQWPRIKPNPGCRAQGRLDVSW